MKKKVSLEEVGETLAFIVENMATKEDFADVRAEMATKDDLKRFATKDDLKRFATKDDLKRFATKDDFASVRAEMATKEDLLMFATQEDIAELRERVKNLEKGQDEILELLRPMSRAQDADSLAIIDHERRIVRLEEAAAA